MKSASFILLVVILPTLLGMARGVSAQDELVELVTGLLADQDKEVRALAFEQIRKEAKGAEATKKFAALLPKFPAETQIGLLSALADRGDSAAAPAVRNLLAAEPGEGVRVAAIKALGALGGAEDLALLVKLTSARSEAVREAAEAGLVSLPGDATTAMIAEIPKSPPSTRIALLKTLTARRARKALPAILEVAQDTDKDVRQAAISTWAELAEPEHVSGMVALVLKTETGRERDAVEKAIATVCRRSADKNDSALPLLAAMSDLTESERAILLSTLGRVGGTAALKVVDEAVASPQAEQREAGLKALCNWPDGAVVSRLLRVARIGENEGQRKQALAALVRVAPLADERDERRRLDTLKTVFVMCTGDAERKMVLERAKAVRSVDTLRFVVPFLNDPVYGEQASQTVVELAHHSSLREANKEEFHRALDQVLKTSQDATVLERVKRYKSGQTWVRPKNNALGAES